MGAIWWDPLGVVRLPQRMVRLLAGMCSFCSRALPHVGGLAGVTGGARICKVCLEQFSAWLADEDAGAPWVPRSARPSQDMGIPDADELARAFQDAGQNVDRAVAQHFVDQVRQSLATMPNGRLRLPFKQQCAFCERPRDAVRKLVGGPSNCVCDSCVARGMSLLSDAAYALG